MEFGMSKNPATLLGVILAAQLWGAAMAEDSVKPFNARYVVQWKAFNVGTSDFELTHQPGEGIYSYVSRSNARGIFRIAFSEEITQESTFALIDGHIQPIKYRADDGSASSAKKISLDFDWPRLLVTGTSEDQPVHLVLKAGTQDVMSVQIELMLDLLAGRLPKVFWVVDNNEVKDFLYSNEGTVKIATALGELQAVILASQRPGADRITRMWFAPALAFVPVKAERTRKGKLEFAMQIKSLKR
jgi:Protein of unknown function (DUF3108)